MEEKKVKIPGISCGHCVATVKNELEDLEGVQSVTGDVSTKEVTIKWEKPASWEKIKETLADINYPASE